jgi:hypothetical protein
MCRSLQIPFTTLYTSGGAKGRIDGVFAIDCPPHIIRYVYTACFTGRKVLALLVCVTS